MIIKRDWESQAHHADLRVVLSRNSVNFSWVHRPSHHHPAGLHRSPLGQELLALAVNLTRPLEICLSVQQQLRPEREKEHPEFPPNSLTKSWWFSCDSVL